MTQKCKIGLPAATVKAIFAWILLPSAVLAIRTRVCAPAENLDKSMDVLRLPAKSKERKKGA